MRYRITVKSDGKNAGGRRQAEETAVMMRWMTVKQVSGYLQISVAKVYQMAQQGEIPCCRLGQQWRFDREEIDRWMRRR